MITPEELAEIKKLLLSKTEDAKVVRTCTWWGEPGWVTPHIGAVGEARMCCALLTRGEAE